MNNLYGLPEVNTASDSTPSTNGVSNLPSNVEYFAGGGGGHKHHHGHRRHRGRYWVKPWNYDYAARPYMYPALAPVYYTKPVVTCGGADCNTYQNEKTGKYEASPGAQCTCCSKGSVCRTELGAPSGVKYDDCCTGTKCIGSGTQGTCM